MIQLYPKGQTDFSRNGIELAPAENEVTWQNGGRYDFAMNIPREMAENVTFDYGQILKVSVPPQIVGPISLGTVSYYTTNKSTKLYSQVPSWRTVKYDAWNPGRGYTSGEKVSYGKKNYQASHAIPPLVDVPPSESSNWTEIARTVPVAGKEIATLESGTSVMKTKDFNSTYMEAATLTGKQGYIKIEDCDATGNSEERIIPQFEITEQLFTIKKIDKVTDAHNIQIEAEHYSYMLGRTMLGECNVVGVTTATALLFIQGAMKEDYPGNLYCGVDEGTIDGDWSWTNAQSAILDSSGGLLKVSGTQAVRDNLDVYIVPAAEGTPTYEVAYGRNMKTVRWTGDVGNIITRVYPLAQREDGSRLTLPEEYIDTELTVPYCRPVKLDTKLKIGQKIQNTDGTEVELTESEVYTRMRQAAQDLFDIDHADQAEVTLALDFVHMPDTEEYKQYLNMRNVAPMEWVRVTGGPMGIETVIQMTGYTWDAIRLEYKSTKYGDKKQKATVSGYDLKSGAVNNRALASDAVRGENIQAGAITAREIEAGSITAEQIASRIITAELIAAGAIRADAIDTDDLTAIQATLQIASIANAQIAVADIGYAQIKDANVQSLIARDALTDRYYIDKLQVRNVQAVNATVGELIVKAKDNKYYRLDIDSSGVLTPTEVTNLTSAEIAAGVTSDGHSSIIETDLTVQDLAASNMKAINALIDKISASRINVDELFARTAFINKLNTTDIETTANLTIKAGGTFTVQSGNFEIDSSGNVSMTGKINAEAGGKIAGWDINADSLTGKKTGIAKTTNDSDIAFWAGDTTAGNANFRVTQGGDVYLRSLKVLNEQGTETTVDLRSYPLWKLSYATVKSMSVTGNTLTIETTGGTINFSKAATTAHLVGGWSGNTYTVYADNDPDVLPVSATLTGSKGTGTTSGTWTIDTFDAYHRAYAAVATTGVTGNLFGFNIDATSEYDAGVSDGTTAGYNSAKLSGSWNGTQWLVTKGTTGTNQVGITISATMAYSTTTHKYTAKANADGAEIDSVESGTQAYDAGVTAGTTAGYNSAKLAGSWSGAVWTVDKGTSGSNSVSLTLSATAAISYDSSTHKYKATGKARAMNSDRASATATSGTEAYDAGVTAGANGVTGSAGSWSNGSLTVTLSNGKTVSVSVGNASGWSLSNTADKTAQASVTVAGKTFTNTFTYNWINHGDYNQGWNECLAACGISGGGTVTVGGSYYANLYVMNQSGPSRVGYGMVNYSARNTVQTK